MPVSPLDADFYRDDNRGTVRGLIIDDSDLDGASEDMISLSLHYDFMKPIKARERAHTLSKLLKHTPLPTTITWNGKGETLEEFIDGIERHVDQQPHMSYLLLPQITKLWLKYGDIDIVIHIRQRKRLHNSLHHIAAEQMANNIFWLYKTLKQSLKKKGKQIVKHFRDSHDRLSV